MKKIISFLLKGLILVILVVTGIWLLYKNHARNNLETKLNLLNENWSKVVKLQDERQYLLYGLIKERPQNIKYLDSLEEILSKYNDYKGRECDSAIIYHQYLANKYALPLLDFYLKDKGTSHNPKIRACTDTINKAIENYNFSVKDYNEYFSVFPNFIIGKSIGLKRKKYFYIQFGIENKDPKTEKKERRSWQRKIELEHGVSE